MKYIGHTAGSSKTFIPGVPTRDLTAEEVKKFGRKALLRSGLYAEVAKKEKPKPQENKLAIPKGDNKQEAE